MLKQNDCSYIVAVSKTKHNKSDYGDKAATKCQLQLNMTMEDIPNGFSQFHIDTTSVHT